MPYILLNLNKISPGFKQLCAQTVAKLQGMWYSCVDAQTQDWTDSDHYKFIVKVLFLHYITAGDIV